mmetsp:Transcript_10050/g.13281  ORF Transcript_10050/g.13281 Transcript_10050/m.13281 type:complete len:286 (-) Transcript_10050:314-1171(-)
MSSTSNTSNTNNNVENSHSNKSPYGFEVNVSKEDFKFHAAHFVAYDGFREPLHGHNYKAGVRLLGQRVGHDGYLIDFGIVKKVTKEVCKKLNNHFICPMESNVLNIVSSTVTSATSTNETTQQDQLTVTCQDGSIFSFPSSDVAQLPIIHASSEELAIYIWTEILQALGGAIYFQQRGIHTMEITVMEAPGQEAKFSWGIPSSTDGSTLSVKSLLATVSTTSPPKPCWMPPTVCCPDCIPLKTAKQSLSLSEQLEQLTVAMNQAGVTSKDGKPLTSQELDQLLRK